MHARKPPAWYVISLRPRGGHGPVRRAAARVDAGVIALSPWRLVVADDAEARATLARALAAPRVLFTSPAAVRAAVALVSSDGLRGPDDGRGRTWFTVGAGTAAALRRAGIGRVVAPARMDSEGALALPGLQDIAGTRIGLVSAPGGRGLIEATLRARGAEVVRADVYARVPVPPSPRAVAALASLRAPAVLLLSSSGALAHVVDALPPPALARLRACPVAAASDRLVERARADGFAVVRRADGPQPAQLVAAAAALVPLASVR